MIDKKDVTLLVHGPISLFTILNLYRYRADYSMVFVIPRPRWNNIHERDEQIKLIDELNTITNSAKYDSVVVIYDPIIPEGCDNRQNRYLHFFSVCLGLDLIKTEYTIKIRSDEFYSDLNPFIRSMDRFGNKIITNDVYFRKPSAYLKHPSDHLMGGKTKLLKDVFTLAKHYCLNLKELFTNPLTTAISKEVEFISSEQVLGISTISTLSEQNEINVLSEIESMQQSFEIVPCENLGFFRVKSNSMGNKEYFDDSYFDKSTDIKDIRDYKY